MNRLVSKFGKYNVAAFIIMGVGLILFLLAPTGWGVGFDSDVLGFFIFLIGLLMCGVGLSRRKSGRVKLALIALASVLSIFILTLVVASIFDWNLW